VAVVVANSPQAKGRVERVHGTHQDRLVKLLRLEGAGTMAAANAINGFQLNHGTNSGENHTSCVFFSGNDVAGTGSGGATDVRLRQRFDTRVNMPGYTGAPNDSAAIISYIQGLNAPLPSVSVATAFTNPPGTDGFHNTPGGAACAVPSFP